MDNEKVKKLADEHWEWIQGLLVTIPPNEITDDNVWNLSTLEYLLKNISNKKNRQKDIALSYAVCLCDYIEKTDWSKINKSIIERWSLRGLKRIKENAYKILEAIQYE